MLKLSLSVLNQKGDPMLTELLKPVLVIVIGFLLRLALSAIGVELDEATFNVLVLGVVAYILSLLGVAGARRVAPNTFK
jgi:hypothetical protein